MIFLFSYPSYHIFFLNCLSCSNALVLIYCLGGGGVRKLLNERGKEKNRSGLLNLLLLRQAFLVSKVQAGNLGDPDLKQVQLEIQCWHAKECDKIKLQAKSDKLNSSESVRIYHHELHAKLN